MDSRAAALAVARRLRAKGHQALLAGGCVRDRLLGLVPKDHDVATSARPEEVRALFDRTVPVGERFGCVQVHPGDGAVVEVTTFRTEGAYADGRRPDAVAFGTDPREDAVRRDFTVNGLFEDPETGRVEDFVGGLADLDARVIRAVGDPHARFAEDRLRMLRAARLAARLGWRIDPATTAAVRAHAGAAAGVAAERVAAELRRILTGGASARGLDLLHRLGLLAVLLPEVAACDGVAQPPEFHPEGDVLVHTRLALAVLDLRPEPPPFALALGVLLHDVGKPSTRTFRDRIRFDGHAEAGAVLAEAACRRLRLSGEEIATVTALVARHMAAKDLPGAREAKVRRFVADPLFPLHLELLRADTLAAHADLSVHRFLEEAAARFAAEPPRPPRILTGDDLAAMGLEPGPRFREILEAVQDAWLERAVATPGEARAFVRRHFLDAPPPGEGKSGDAPRRP